MCGLEAANQATRPISAADSSCAFFTVIPLLSVSFVHYHRPSPPNHQQTKTAPQIPQIEASMDLQRILNQTNVFGPSTLQTSDRSTSPNEPVAAPYAPEDDSPDEDSIRSKCRQVDWDSLPTLADVVEHKYPMRRFQPIRTIKANHEQLATSSCKICRILSVLKPEYLHKTECVVVARSLLRFRSYALPHHWTSRREITALHVSRWDISLYPCLVAIRRDSEDFRSMMINPRSVDYDRLRRLARLCEETHKGRCRPRSVGPVSDYGLKFIEVSSRTVIEAPTECRYMALSYVWGKQPEFSPTLHLQRLPRLIEDAISVTIVMGYKYLWVDRYVSLLGISNTNVFMQI